MVLDNLCDLTRPKQMFVAFLAGPREEPWDTYTTEDFRHVVWWWRLEYLEHPEFESLWTCVDPTKQCDHTMTLNESAFARWYAEVESRATEIWRGAPEERGGPWFPATCVTAFLRSAGLGWGAVRPAGLRKLVDARGWNLVWTPDHVTKEEETPAGSCRP